MNSVKQRIKFKGEFKMDFIKIAKRIEEEKNNLYQIIAFTDGKEDKSSGGSGMWKSKEEAIEDMLYIKDCWNYISKKKGWNADELKLYFKGELLKTVALK